MAMKIWTPAFSPSLITLREKKKKRFLLKSKRLSTQKYCTKAYREKIICKNVDELWGHHAKGNKSDKDKYCMISFICGIKKKKKPSYRVQICVYQKQRAGEGRKVVKRYKFLVIQIPMDVMYNMITIVNAAIWYVGNLLRK